MSANDVAILTTDQMARADALAIEGGTAGIDLMESAGKAVADAAARMDPDLPIHVLCGPGNNGGDGFVAARLLQAADRKVELYLLGDIKALKGDAAKAAALWRGAVKPLADYVAQEDSIVIDALFGAGLARALEGEPARVVTDVNASGALVLAVDVPSGLDGTTGKTNGPAIEADETITFFRLKPAHVLMPGRVLCGDVSVAEIGIPETVLATIAPKTFLNDPDLWLGDLPVPDETAHKYKRGHALVVSGDALHTGASRLAAYSAFRSGAGLVTLTGARDALLVHANHVTAIMLAEAEDAAALDIVLSDERKNAIIVGPAAGVGADTRDKVLTVLKTKRATVIDADGLTSFADDPTSLHDQLHEQCVLTPHGWEFERIFPGVQDTAASKVEATRVAAKLAGAVVLLKGADTVIASPDGRAAVTANAPPWLATAGSGDVLAGVIGGFLAQRMPTFEAACAGAWVHGEAGNHGGLGLIAEDLPGLIPTVLEDFA